VLLKICGYEYEYVKFSWILSMGSPKYLPLSGSQSDKRMRFSDF
jgi:hypothetical protein